MNAKVIILLAMLIVGGVSAYFLLEDRPTSFVRKPGGYIDNASGTLFSRYQMGEKDCAKEVKTLQSKGVEVGGWDIHGYTPNGDCHIYSPEQLKSGTYRNEPVPKGQVRVAYVPKGYSVSQ